MLLGLLGALLVVRSVVRPLGATTRQMQALAEGRPDTVVTGADRLDEIGGMARALNVFRASMEARRQTEAETEAIRSVEAQNEGLRAMADTVEAETRQGIAMMSEQMDKVILGASQISSTADRLMAESASSRIEAGAALESANAVAAATEELGASIGEITARLAEASKSTRNAAELGTIGREMIGALSQAVSRIGGVARLIGGIAGQTNPLALNATIKAARSDEAGKGFAVVAGEVKALTAQTAKATEEISREIAAVMHSTERAVAVVREMADAVGEVDQVTTAIAAAMEEQSAATREIASAVAQAAAASGRVASGMDEVADASAESGREADAMRSSSSAAQSAVEAVRNTIIRVIRESTDTTNRRGAPRLSTPCAVRLRLAGRTEMDDAQLRDISGGGFGLSACSRSLQPGEKLALLADTLLPGMELSCEVLRVVPDGNVSCRFVALRPEQAEALATLVGGQAMARLAA